MPRRLPHIPGAILEYRCKLCGKRVRSKRGRQFPYPPDERPLAGWYLAKNPATIRRSDGSELSLAECPECKKAAIKRALKGTGRGKTGA